MVSQTNRGLQSVQDRTVVITGGEFGHRPRDSSRGCRSRRLSAGTVENCGATIRVSFYAPIGERESPLLSVDNTMPRND
jgi:hypothetical protein